MRQKRRIVGLWPNICHHVVLALDLIAISLDRRWYYVSLRTAFSVSLSVEPLVWATQLIDIVKSHEMRFHFANLFPMCSSTLINLMSLCLSVCLWLGLKRLSYTFLQYKSNLIEHCTRASWSPFLSQLFHSSILCLVKIALVWQMRINRAH